MKNLSLFVLLCLVLFSCRKNLDTELTNIIEPNPPVIKIDVSAAVQGIVLDESGNPIAEAFISLGEDNTWSNEDGLFVFNNMTMNQSGTFIKAEKEGYFNGSTRFFPKEDSKNFAKIILMETQIIGSLDAGTGGTVSSSEGISLAFPPGSIVDANNETYNGPFSIAARWLNPEAENIFDIMPGNLQGINADGSQVALVSYGMMAVELFDQDGNLLQLGNGEKAMLSFPLPQNYLSQAPTQIPLWYFNESTGLWEEEGQASLEGNYYVGEVAHFSFWNCDVPFDLVKVSGRLINKSPDQSLIPIANAFVKFSSFSIGTGFGYTDQDGYFAGFIPQGVELKMEVYEREDCNTQIYATTLAPLFADENLGDIICQAPGQYIEVIGSLVDCDENPITDGWIKATLNGNSSMHYVDNNDFQFFLFNCDAATEIEIIGIDYAAEEQSEPQVFPMEDQINVGSIQACGVEVEEFFRLNLNGEDRVHVLDLEKMAESQVVFGNGSSSPFSMTFWDPTGQAIAPGEYDQSNVLTFSYRGTFDFSNNMQINNGCSGLTLDCIQINNFTITGYSGVIGDFAIGNFSAMIDLFEPGSGERYEDLPLTVEFSLPIKPF